MKRKIWMQLVKILLLCVVAVGCGGCAGPIPSNTGIEDGEYTVNVELSGGTGRAEILSPAELTVKDGSAVVRIEWSSSSYDYMIVDGEKYLPVNENGNSVFEISVTGFDEAVPVIADTTAMSVPHEIEYELIFHSDSIEKTGETTGTAASGSDRVSYGAASGDITPEKDGAGKTDKDISEKANTDISPELTYSHRMPLTCAKEFAVDYYEDDYALITISDGSRFLVIPEGMEIPSGLEEDIVLLKQPIENIYLVASAVMDMFDALDALEDIRFSALKPDAWYVPDARAAMEAGDILYAGKYSAPDYEQIVSGNCGLAIENTMIYHTPEVKEQLEQFDIPVLVDYSSYEAEPLGRTEWVKLYGLLVGKEEAAKAAFDAEVQAFESVSEKEAMGQTVAFFYITSNGEANVRKSSDYLPKMIELAGGRYIFDHLGDEEDMAASTVTMQMEEFYAGAQQADYIIYNSTIDGELSSVEELLAKSSLLENFKAVQEGHVFCTTKNLYQSSMELGTIISDIHQMLSGETDSMTYIYQLK